MKAREHQFRVVYVVTSKGEDAYSNMALLSMISVKLSNPKLQIVAVCDQESGDAIKAVRHRLLEVCDELIAVQVPDATAGFRNRWLKTSLPQYVKGKFLYLDNDTLVRGSLEELMELKGDIAAAPNHSGSGSPDEMPGTEMQVYASMRWDLPANYYVNGGAIYSNGTQGAANFFQAWHQFWKATMVETGQHFDQPALNHALATADFGFIWLPGKFNAQVHARPGTALDGIIWHFYTSDHHISPRTVMDLLMEELKQTPGKNDKRVQQLCSRIHPWIVREPVAWYAVRSMISNMELLNGDRWERLWLSGQRRIVLRRWLFQGRDFLRKCASGAKRIIRLRIKEN